MLLLAPQAAHGVLPGAPSSPSPVATPEPTPTLAPTPTPTLAPIPTPAQVVTPETFAQPVISTEYSILAPVEASGVTNKSVSSDLVKVRALLAVKDYSLAMAALKIADKDFPKDADINNFLGFSSRKLQLYKSAAIYYKKALAINPQHLGALAYQGELFIATKKVKLAKKNLATLARVCGINCKEYEDLKKAMERARIGGSGRSNVSPI